MVKVKGHIYATYEDNYNEGKGTFKKEVVYKAWPYKDDHLGVLISSDVTCDEVPEIDIIKGTIEYLKKKQQDIKAHASVKVEELEQQIQELLFIEHKG